MSAAQPHLVPDDYEDESLNSSDSELELLDYDSDTSELEITQVAPKERFATRKTDARNYAEDDIRPPDTEIQRYKLRKGCTLKPGDTVELRDHSAHEGEPMHSGDFLRIRRIIMDLETDEVRLRGHRLRRTKYLGQIFDWKLNELSMVLRVDENDPRCPFVAGLEDISVDEVLCTRECVLTNKNYPLLSFRSGQLCAFPSGLSKQQIKQQMFHGGRLACRVVNILFINDKGKTYSGIVRHLYGKESDAASCASSSDTPGLSRNSSIVVDDDDLAIPDTESHGLSGTIKRRARSPSVTELDGRPRKKRSPVLHKSDRYTFGDVFCGAGGASQGAKQAGLHVTWGLDHDKDAIIAYQSNHPGALPFRRSAHDFPPRGYTNEDLRVCVLHLSPPCCYFSPAHTTNGPNDQANLEAIYTVGPILKKVRPRVATLEQTFGLSTREQHKPNFNLLLYDLGKAGYDVRYKIQDLSEFGLVQARKRLLIIAARHGTPLPPFPKATHGPIGSGLKRFTSIRDALLPIERLANRPTDDQYHQPKIAARPREPYSSNSFLKGCITTNGAEKYHYTGIRKYTARELGLFQSFPVTYQFYGSQTEATKQVGNAFPPIMAEALYRTIAKTLEAFDNGFIDAEDDLSDLDGILARKGAQFPKAPSTQRSLFDATPRPTNVSYRYLVRGNSSSSARSASTSSPFARKKAQAKPSRNRPASSFRQRTSFLEGLLDGFEDEDHVQPSVEADTRFTRSGSAADDAIELSSDSNDESDSETE
ncbi:S-adenosyl-L-methionine-dependent methyltransferase [Paraphoma chrysanthemicola]|uniref:DNA (cytosine-5-)-methyltransferase n=1 Tax=Paraphoma chrysanthemicola TaxID=798071 RepID=A0A8K0W1M8_9PLEO|nr:S-adenosyl-L-methionine-dependent methyltransferase [Paraphoma chrysanthemicola]